MRYVIAYDIADPKRLRRVAKLMEQRAIRVQKSVFSADLSTEQLHRLMEDAAELMDLEEDIVQAWRLASQESPEGQHRGLALCLLPQSVICGGNDRYCVREGASS